MTQHDFASSPLSADEALQRALELELQAGPRADGFTKRSLLRQASTYRALAEIRQFSRSVDHNSVAA
jgi:hypothetical protein